MNRIIRILKKIIQSIKIIKKGSRYQYIIADFLMDGIQINWIITCPLGKDHPVYPVNPVKKNGTIV